MLAQATPTDSPEAELIPYRNKRKWGFADATGVLQIKAKHDTVDFFRAGLAVAGRSGQLGLIDPNGTWIVPRRYAAIRFDPRYRRYWLQDRKTNAWFIRMQEGQLTPATELGQDVAELDGLYQRPATAIAPHRGYSLSRDGAAYVLTQPDGTTRRLDGAYDSVAIARPFRLYFYQNERWGVMSYQEEVLFPAQFEALEPAPTTTPPRSDQDIYAAQRAGKWGLVSWERGELLPFQYQAIDRLSHPTRQLFRLTLNGLQGFYDLTAAELHPPAYLYLSAFDRKGLAQVRTTNGRLGYLRWDGTKYFVD